MNIGQVSGMLNDATYVGKALTDLDTPAVTIDLEIVHANIGRLQRYLSEHGILNRPHVKAHRMPVLARAQMAAGAVGITCQTLGEAEVMADAGFADILVSTNLVGPAKVARLAALGRRVGLSAITDNPVVTEALSRAAIDGGFTLPVLVECDTGLGRCGAQTPAAALELAQEISRKPGLIFRGLLIYPISQAASDFVTEACAILARAGLAPEVISSGGTPGVWVLHKFRRFTEHRAGAYVFNDRSILATEDASLEDCSMRVVASVVSRPLPDRAVINAGTKTLSAHPGRGVTGFGLVIEYPAATIHRLTEEHGIIDLSQCRRKPEIGEVLTIIPNHASLVANLFETAIGVEKGRVKEILPVLARGRSQ